MSKLVSGRTATGPCLHALSRTMRHGVGRRLGVGLALVSLFTSLSAPVAMGQVITDPRAPIQFRPKVGKSANGTPVIDITKPSFGGISHNKFQRYDVDARGLILNNSKLTGTSIIGGKVVANPNLQGQRPARVILNEVTSSASSTLNGTTEVFGSRADVIVANPNGVGCVGCSFINSGRVTLSTGTPRPDYRRGTVSYDVSRGTVSVDGTGLLGVGKSLKDVDLIGRQLRIDGPVQAKGSVRLRAGGMIYDQRGDTVTPKDAADLGAIVGPAIASGASGTIKAGTLSVVSRDVDVGIALTGDLTTSSGAVIIRSAGDLSVKSANAKGDLQLTADGQVRLTGNGTALGRIVAYGSRIEVTAESTLASDDTIVLEAVQSLASRGILKAGNAVSIVSGGELIAEGSIASNGEIAFEGKSFRSTGLKISGSAVSVAGIDAAVLNGTEIVATKESVKVGGQQIELGQGTGFQAGGRIVIDAKDSLINGTVLDYANLDLSVRNRLTNTSSGQLVQDHLLLTIRDGLVNAGTLQGRVSTKIAADALTNTETGVIHGPDVILTLSNGMNNLGQVVSDRTLTIVAGDVVNKGNLRAGSELKLQSRSYRADSTAATLSAAKADLIVTGVFENSGKVVGLESLSLSALGAVGNDGAIETNGILDLDGASYRGGADSSLNAAVVNLGQRTDRVSLGAVENSGVITAVQSLSVKADSLSNLGAGSSIAAGAALIDLTGDLTNQGTIGSRTRLKIAHAANVFSSGSLLVDGPASGGTAPVAPGDLEITASGRVVSGADLIASGAVVIDAASFEGNTAAARLGGASVTANVAGLFSSLGQISAQSSVTVTAGEIAIGPSDAAGTAGTVLGKTIALTSSGDIVNQGTVSGVNGLTLSATGIVRNTGVLATDEDLTLTADQYRSTAGAKLGGKKAILRIAGEFENLGLVAGTELVDIEASSVVNGPTVAGSQSGRMLGKTITLGSDVRRLTALTNHGAIEAGEGFSVKTASLTNGGSLIADATGTVSASGAVSNDGKIATGATLTLTAASYLASTATANLSSKVLTVDLQAGTLSNAGTIYGATSLGLTSGSLTNAGAASAIGAANAVLVTNGSLVNEGQISAVGSLDLTVHGAVTNAGSITTNHVAVAPGTVVVGDGKLTLQADGAVTSTGLLASTGKLSINAASLTNAATTAQMGGSSMVVELTGDFTNHGFVNGGTDLDIESNAFWNGPGTETVGLIKAASIGIVARSHVTNLGSVESSTDLVVTGAAELSNSGTIATDGLLKLALTGGIHNANRLAAHDLQLSGTLYSGTAGSQLNGTSITAAVGGMFTNAGQIDARSLFSLTAHNVSNLAGGKIGGDRLVVASAHLTNSGTIESQVLGTFTISENLTNAGQILSEGDLVITGNGARLNVNLIQAKNSLGIEGGSLTNGSGARLQGKTVSLSSTGAVLNFGIIDGTDLVAIGAASLSNQGMSLANYASISSNDLRIDVSGGDLTVGTNSLLQGTQNAVIKARTVDANFFKRDTIAQGQFAFGNDLDFTLTQGGWMFNENLKTNGNLRFQVAGNIVNRATIAAGGTLTLISTNGSITNGVNSQTDPGGGMIYSNGDMTLDADDHINNYASVIQTGGNLTLNAGGTILNTRTDTRTVTSSYVIPGGTPALAIVETMVETSGPASIDAMGSIVMNANAIKNVASSIIAGGNIFLGANTILNQTRELTKTERHYRDGEVFGPWVNVVGTSHALILAGGTFRYRGILTDHGTIEADTVVGHGPGTSVGGSTVSGPTRIPDPIIDLAGAIDLVGRGLVRGSGPAYVPDPEAGSGSVDTRTGDGLTADVNAEGRPVNRPGDVSVRPGGRISFLYATPVPSGANERNPSWIFAQVGANAANLTFFADPATERRLIQQAMIEQTGRAVLDPKYRNPKEQQEKLYEGTVDFLRANPEIKLGAKLTAAQRAKVKKPILWYEYQTVNGKKVLVPQLILPEGDLAKYASIPGGAIIADNVFIKSDKVTNTGSILAADTLSIQAKEFLNERRVASSGGFNAPMTLQPGGFMSAKTMVIATTGDLTNRGGAMVASSALVLKAGGHIHIEAQSVANTTILGSKKSWSITRDVTHAGALVSSGGNLVIESKKTLNILGSTVAAANDALLVGRKGVTIASVLDEHDVMGGGRKSGFLTKSSFGYADRSVTNVSSVVSAGGNMTVRSEKGDITVAASHLIARKDLAVLAGYDADGKAVEGAKASVRILSGQDGHDTAAMHKKSGFGLFASGGGVDFYRSTKTTQTTSEARNVAASLSAGGNLAVKARRDIDIEGSVINAEGFASLEARRDVTVRPGENASGSDTSKKVKGVGIGVSAGEGGFGVRAGYHASSRSSAYDQTSVASSVIRGDKGVSVRAGRDIVMTAATIGSDGHVGLVAGRDLELLAGANRESSYQSAKEVFAGIQLKVSENVSGAVRQLQQAPATFTSGHGKAGLKALGMASGTLQLIDGIKQLSNPTVSASVTVGASGSRAESRSVAVTAVGTAITAGSLSLKAGRDIHLVGTQGDVVKDIAIAAGRDLTVESAQSTTATYASSSSWHAGVGVSAGLGASGATVGVTAEGGLSRSHAASWSVTQVNAHLKAGGTVSVTTGRDATFAGATVTATNIDLDVGRHLTVTSRQDRAHSSTSSMSVGGSVTVGIGGSPSSASVNLGGGRGSSDLAWVSEQSGLFATNRLDVRVEKHTQLNGGVLSAAPGQLTLDTGTLGFKDLQDHDRGSSVSGQVGLSTPGAAGQLPGVTVQGAYASHDREQTTRATIGEGTVTIRNEAKQKQDVAAINRDVTQSQVITKDQREGVSVYVSDTSIKTAVSVLEQVGSTLKDAFSASVESRKDIDPNTKKAAGKLLDDMMSGKVKPEEVQGCLQQGFNLHNLLFTPAYASGACGAYSKEAIKLCFGFIDNMRAGLVEKGADLADTFKQRLKEDPEGFEKAMKLLSLTPASKMMEPLEEKIKAEVLKNPEDAKAVADAIGSYLADQKQKLENGEITETTAIGATLLGLIAVAKYTPKGVRDKVLDKISDLAGNVLNVARNSTAKAGFDTSNLESKLAKYLLDPTNPQNKGKAEWYKQALGFTQANWEGLAKQIVFDTKKAVLDGQTEYGANYVQNIMIKGANGKTVEATFVFMKSNADGKIRLVTGLPRSK